MMGITITNYEPRHQEGIDEMMLLIQKDFSEAITGPKSVIIKNVYQLEGQHYWVALMDQLVVGTIGAVLHPSFAEIKRMMVHPDYRGPGHNTASLLLEAALNWTRAHQCPRIYLGTMEQFKAAQRFYEKHQFVKLSPSELPADYTINPIDTVFYTRVLA